MHISVWYVPDPLISIMYVVKLKVSTPTTCQFWQIHFCTWFRTMSADACNWRFRQQILVNFDKSFVLLGLYHAAPNRKPQWGVNLLLLWDQEWQHLPKVRILSFRTPNVRIPHSQTVKWVKLIWLYDMVFPNQFYLFVRWLKF